MTVAPTNAKSTEPVPIRPASSLLVIRQHANGLEVMVLQRSEKLRFLPGFLSFPGGSVDDEDYVLTAELGVEAPLKCQQADDIAYAVAALRECAEETGVTFSMRKAGQSEGSQSLVLTEEQQTDLLANRLTFEALLQAENWKIAGETMRFVGRWITPPNMPARFDTRFFVTVAEPGDVPIRINEGESSWGRWCRPQDVLHDIEAKKAKAAPPTVAMLQALAEYENVADCYQGLDVPAPSSEELMALAERLKSM